MAKKSTVGKVKVDRRPGGGVVKVLTIEHTLELSNEEANKRLAQLKHVESQLLAKLENVREQMAALEEALK